MNIVLSVKMWLHRFAGLSTKDKDKQALLNYYNCMYPCEYAEAIVSSAVERTNVQPKQTQF